MYCTTCGKELIDGASVCHHCGFKAGEGYKYCSHCGVSVQSGQTLCVSCGFMLTSAELLDELSDEEKLKKSNKYEYKKYENRIRKTKVLSLSVQILSIFLVASLIFLPIFTYAYVPQSIEDIRDLEDLKQLEEELKYEVKDLEELEELLKNGTIEKRFSLWDDFKIVVANLFSDDGDKATSFLLGVFVIFAVVSTAIFICTAIGQIMKNINDINEIDKTSLLLYSEIKKLGAERKIEKLFKQRVVTTMAIYILSDILLCKINVEILEKMPSNMGPAITRNMLSLTGVSPLVSIVIILLIGYFVLNRIMKREEDNLAVAIAKEDVETVE